MPLTNVLHSRLAALVRALGVFAGAGAAAYALFELLRPGGGPWESADYAIYYALLASAAALCLVRAAAVPSERGVWAALGAGMAAWLAGETVWDLAYAGDAAAPFPSPADALYLLFYPGAFAALVLLLRRRAQAVGASVWLDGVAGACAAAALGAALLLPVLSDAGEGSAAAVATNLAYPLADLLLAGFAVLGWAIAGWRPERALLLFAGGLALLGIADGLYLDRVALDGYREGTVLDALWPAGMALAGLAAWQRPERRRTARPQSGWVALAMPTVFTVAALGLLIYGNARPLGATAIALAAVALLITAIRTALAFRELRALAITRRQAVTDELTGLANRRLLYERLDRGIAAARSSRRPLAFLLIDLDGFKEFNDALGHTAGDLLLRDIGPRLGEALRPQDLLARLGGDEFGVLLADTSPEEAQAVGIRIRTQLERPFSIDGLSLAVDASIGAAVFPDHGGDTETLIQHADIAMYAAKAARTGVELYAPSRDVHSRDRLALVSELRQGIEAGQLVLHYQPKATPTDREVTGVEALVRWQHPERGLLGPGEFLPLAEQTGLMRPLTLFVIDRALEQCAAWAREGLDLSVAVNLGQVNLIDRQLPGDVRQRLERWGVPAERLHLEITENLVMADPLRTMNVLASLRALGVSLSLDDFGTGQTSLAYLRRLALDEIKIDRSFVTELAHDEDAAAIVRSTVQMARALRLRVVAEGAEDAGAWARLEEFGCELVQGYFLSPPLPADELTGWLRERHLPAAA